MKLKFLFNEAFLHKIQNFMFFKVPTVPTAPPSSRGHA